MRISDWSSDVCSSDLDHSAQPGGHCEGDDGEQPEAPGSSRLGRGHAGQWRGGRAGLSSLRHASKPEPDDRRGGARDSGERQISRAPTRSEEHTSELQSLMRISYAVFCLKKKKKNNKTKHDTLELHHTDT